MPTHCGVAVDGDALALPMVHAMFSFDGSNAYANAFTCRPALNVVGAPTFVIAALLTVNIDAGSAGPPLGLSYPKTAIQRDASYGSGLAQSTRGVTTAHATVLHACVVAGCGAVHADGESGLPVLSSTQETDRVWMPPPHDAEHCDHAEICQTAAPGHAA